MVVLVWGGNADCAQDPPLALVSAPPGTYTLHVGAEGDLAGKAELVMPAPGAELPTFRVALAPKE